MIFGDFLNTLASKAGIKSDNAELIKFLSVKEVATAEIPDTIVSSFNSLMTLEAAKNNPDVQKSIKAELYNGVDSAMNKSYDELGLDDATKQELLLEKNTNARITKSLKKIADLEKAKAAAPKGEKVALEAEIANLNGQIKKANEDKTEAIKSMKTEHENAILTYDLKNQLAGFNYAFPKEMPKDLQVETALLTLNANLQAKDAKLIRENGALKLVRVSTNGAYFNDKNEAVDAKGFIDSTLAQNKLLAVTDTTNTNQTTTTTTILNTANKPFKGHNNFAESVDSAIEAFDKGSMEAVA